MSGAQLALICLLGAMLAAFSLSRFRIEIVAIVGLAVAYLLQLVPADAVFAGFGSPIVITVLEILLIIEVLRGSHVIEAVGARLSARFATQRTLVPALAAMGAFLSVFMNNIGALALMLPLATSVCDRHEMPLQRVLMPLSFATLLGGLCSAVGTPANIVASGILGALRGTPLGFFELGVVGLPLVMLGLAYFGLTGGVSWLAAARPRSEAALPRTYLLAVLVPPGSPLIDGREPDDAEIVGRTRDGRYSADTSEVAPGDLIMLRADLATLDRLAGSGVVASTPMLDDTDVERVEAVVMPESIFVGSRVLDLEPLVERDIRVDGLSIVNVAPDLPLDEQRLRVGDILVLRGEPAVLDEELHECGLTPILPSPAPAAKPNWLPVAVFGLGVLLTAVAGLRAEIAFGLVVVVLALTGDLSLRRGLETMNWPILVMLGAMIPLGEAVATTGLAQSFAEAVASFLPTASAPAVIGAMLALSVLLTPFVNNPSTVLVLAPVGIELAGQYGVAPEPVVIAITIGASLDFITPFGHHNNTLVMGIANYRFIDFLRYGLPLLVLTGLAAFLIVSLMFVR